MKKRLLALALVVLLLLSFAACGKSSIVGKWKWEIDFGPIINQQLADSGMEEFFDFSGLKLQLNMEFKADGSCTLGVDEASLSTMRDALADAYIVGMKAYCESLNTSLEALGVTEEELVEQAMEGIDTDALSERFMPDGKYELVGDKLFTWDASEEKDDGKYLTVKLDGDTLTFVAAVGGESNFPEELLPATLNRIG